MDSKGEADQKHKAHCLILTYPLIGHLNPMIQFSKRLSHKGIKITIVVTRNLFKTLKQISGPFPVETISDGFDEGRGDVPLEAYSAKFEHVGGETLSELLLKLKHSGRPVDCLIYDPFLPWSVVVAKKFGLLAAAFFTQSCAVNKIYYHVYAGELKVPDLEKETLIPGLPPLSFSDFPSFISDPEGVPGAFHLLSNQFQNIEKVDYVFVNSVYELEEEVTDLISKLWPVKTIGPTIPSMHLDKRLWDDKEYGLSIFKPASDCMKWLEKRASRSVVYVSFGSMARLQVEQMEELALGLKMTDKYFLWVVRSSEESKLPKDFEGENYGRGLIVSWCPQLEVLSHEAIGCFVTHCGWNSTLEALSQGVPMVAIPWWSDQSTNAKFVMDVWKIGVKAQANVDKKIVGRDEIVRCIKCIMEDEAGEHMRKNAGKWKEMVRHAVDEGGSSDINTEEFVSELASSLN